MMIKRKRSRRVDRLNTQTHIVCSIWNINIDALKGYHPDAWWEVSQEGIAELLRFGRATVQRAIKELVKADCLTVKTGSREEIAYLWDHTLDDEPRGKTTTRYHVTKEQVVRMALRLYREQSDVMILQNPDGWLWMLYQQQLRELIEVGIVNVHKTLPTLAYSKDQYIYHGKALEGFSRKRGKYVPVEYLDDDELQEAFQWNAIRDK